MHVFSARTFWLPVLLATLVAAFFGAVLARRGRVLKLMLARRSLLETRLWLVRQENRQARAERDALLSSPEAIEQVARVDFGFVAPGDQVVQLPPDPRRSGRSRPAASDLPAWQEALMWPQLPLALPAATFVLSGVLVALANVVYGRRRAEP